MQAQTMAWVYLLLAAAFEIVFAVSLKYVDGLARPGMLALTAIGGIGGFFFLALAAKTLPISVAYPIWTALGVMGVVIFGAAVLGEPVTALKVASVVAIIGGIAGLRIANGS
jgi:quaternary ammonium compound-resistance protein SugE